MSGICFDTSPLIWGVQGHSKDSQLPMVAMTRAYITSLKSQNETIIVPAPALSEFLIKFSDHRREALLQMFNKKFFVAPVDARAAIIAAEIAAKTTRPKSSEERQRVKVDIQIVAIAIAQKASTLITHDLRMADLAKDRLRVSEVPVVAHQTELGFQASSIGR